jgi:hypothetical protein
MASQWMVDRVDGVYTRSYDVSVAAPLSFSFCEITVESGAYIAHIEVVQTATGPQRRARTS